MSYRRGPMAICCLLCLAAVAGLAGSMDRPAALGQDTAATAQEARFEFEVVESFDAKYLGDTPGHHGRSGGLGNRRPRVALGDPVFRGDEQVGVLTQVVWDRSRGSLDLEFDPQPSVRVCVGDVVWIHVDGPPDGAEPK